MSDQTRSRHWHTRYDPCVNARTRRRSRGRQNRSSTCKPLTTFTSRISFCQRDGLFNSQTGLPQSRGIGTCIWVPAVDSTRSLLPGNHDILRQKILSISWSFGSRRLVTLSRSSRVNIQVTAASMICGGLKICPRILHTHKLRYATMFETSTQPSSHPAIAHPPTTSTYQPLVKLPSTIQEGPDSEG